jgi:hypothetical protein
MLEELNNRTMRHVGKSRREPFEEIERAALKPSPVMPFEYAEWKSAKVPRNRRSQSTLVATRLLWTKLVKLSGLSESAVRL